MMEAPTIYGALWAHMLDAARKGDGLWLDADGVARAVGCSVDGVGVFDHVATHREADYVTASNHDVARGILSAISPEGEGWSVVRFGSDLVGWFDHVFIDTGDVRIVTACDEMRHAMDAYPILNEQHAAEMEWDMGHPRPGECYSDAGADCPCREGEAA
jgi:hypothetical protein